MNSPSLIAATLWAVLPLPVLSGVVSAQENVVLRNARRAGAVDQVSVTVDGVGGRMGGEPHGAAKSDAKPEKTPIRVACNLEFHERAMRLPSDESKNWLLLRHYGRAEATLDIGGEKLTPSLRPERRYIAVDGQPAKTEVFSPQGPLTLDELDMLNVIGNSVLLEALLPADPVSVGHSWKLPDELVAALLDFDELREHDIEAKVTEITATVVRFEFGGKASGRKNDAAISNEIKGKYRFDLRLKRIDWLGMVARVHEEVSAVKAGFDLDLRVQVRVTPDASTDALADKAIDGIALEATEDALKLEHRDTGGQWHLLHSRDWHFINYHRDVATLRLVSQGEFVGQCSISPLPKRPPNKLPALSEFQQDVQKALGQSYGALVEAAEAINDSGYRILRIVADGRLGDAPKQWRYFHVADRDGRQTVLAFNVDEKLADRMAGAAKELVAGFRFVGDGAGNTPGTAK